MPPGDVSQGTQEQELASPSGHRDEQGAKEAAMRDHRSLVLWAADCAERALPYFEEKYPKDARPRKAVEAARAWARGEIALSEVRAAAFAAHAAARAAAADAAARSAARAAGHAAATAHVATHAAHAATHAAHAATYAAHAATYAATGSSRCTTQPDSVGTGSPPVECFATSPGRAGTPGQV